MEYRSLSRYRSELMGLAILWVMLFHAYSFHFGFLPLDGIKALGFCGVDIFIMLSGMGLFVSLSKHPEQSALTFYSRRLTRILPAYWLVVGVYSLWLRLCGRISLTVALWSMSTLHYWFHIPGSFNWYVPAVMLFYLLTPAYVKLFTRCPRKEWLTVAAFPVSYVLWKLSGWMGVDYIADFLYRIPVFAIGILMGWYLQSDQKLTTRRHMVWSAMAVCGLILLPIRLANRISIPTCYLFLLVVTELCLVGCWILKRLSWTWLESGLRTLGECSLEIYLFNVVITREFETLTAYFDPGSRHVAFYLVAYAVNIALGILLHRTIAKWAAAFKSQPIQMK